MIVPRQNAGVPDEYTARDNYIHDNTFYLDETGVEVVAANSGSVNTYAWNNTRIPNGNMYIGDVTTTVPPGYDPGSNPPPDPPPPSPTDSLKLQYDCAETASTTKTIKPDILIVNNGSSDTLLAGYSIRYWFTKDGLTPKYSERYIEFGSSYADGVFGTANGMDYLQVNLSGGTVEANDDIKIKISISNTTYNYYTQTNDYSFDPSITSFTDYIRITLYKDGVLVWGTEP